MLSRNSIALGISFLVMFAVVGVAVAGNSFNFKDENGRNSVRFTLDAPLEVINGLSNDIEGSLQLEGKTFSGSLAVPVASISTGIKLRDEHMQSERWLNAKKTPKILFHFKNAVAPSFEDQKPKTGTLKGSFTINGVTREETVSYTATWFKESDSTKSRGKGDLLVVRAKAKLRLEDYGIKRDSMVVLKVGEFAEVTVDLVGQGG